ncbi:MAG: hypothetical protein POH28_06465 [Acidocella sp.]|nr:hypothetical protein [Acidocella sp.]
MLRDYAVGISLPIYLGQVKMHYAREAAEVFMVWAERPKGKLHCQQTIKTFTYLCFSSLNMYAY